MKYRVWNNATKRFLRTSTYIDSDGNLYKDNDPHGLDMSGKRSISPMPNCTVMRSTGLHDKNGKEIFEGDLVNYKYLEGEKPFEVVFDEDVAAFKIAKDEYYMGFLGEKKRHEIEVIGNIYQHNHLLS